MSFVGTTSELNMPCQTETTCFSSTIVKVPCRSGGRPRPELKALALSARTETRDYVDMVEMHRTFPLPAICWAACGKDPGFRPLSLLKMMKRFAKVDPAKLEEIQARAPDPKSLKLAWIERSDAAEAEMIRLADKRPDLPIGVAFVDRAGKPGWIGNNPTLRLHAPSVRGC